MYEVRVKVEVSEGNDWYNYQVMLYKHEEGKYKVIRTMFYDFDEDYISKDEKLYTTEELMRYLYQLRQQNQDMEFVYACEKYFLNQKWSEGEFHKLIEYEEGLRNFLKELESKRADEDIFNTDKYKALYEVYFRVVDEINNY